MEREFDLTLEKKLNDIEKENEDRIKEAYERGTIEAKVIVI